MVDWDSLPDEVLIRDRNHRWYINNGKEYAREYRKNKPDIKTKVAKSYYERHKERLLAKAKENYYTKKEKNSNEMSIKARELHLKRSYGISLSVYEEMLIKQDNKCKICKSRRYRTKLFVDHCHYTKRVRGLICITCNTTLGHYERYKIEIQEYLK